jgi:hypothetical protein
MVLTPLIRGLLGIDVDAPSHRVAIAPHLPPEWDSVEVNNVPVGGAKLSFAIRRTAGRMTATVKRSGDATPIDVVFSPALPLGARVDAGRPAPNVGDLHATVRAMVTDAAELSVSYTGGWSIVPPSMPAKIGHRSEAMRVISERLGADGQYIVSLEGIAGRRYEVRLTTPTGERTQTLTFPATGVNADGYTALTMTLR